MPHRSNRQVQTVELTPSLLDRKQVALWISAIPPAFASSRHQPPTNLGMGPTKPSLSLRVESFCFFQGYSGSCARVGDDNVRINPVKLKWFFPVPIIERGRNDATI